jgi:hypothetical protein
MKDSTFAKPHKKMAVLLFGISKYNYSHWSRTPSSRHYRPGGGDWNVMCNYEIDYRYSVTNYRERIFKYFNELEYDIDIYFATNNIPEEDRSDLLAAYPAKDYHFEECDPPKNKTTRNKKLRKVCEMCLRSKAEYDLVLITRFDMFFLKDFNNVSFDFNTLNIISKLERPCGIDDNFYLLRGGDLQWFIDCIKPEDVNGHALQPVFEKHCSINFFCNENVAVPFLSFFRLVRSGSIYRRRGRKYIHMKTLERFESK